VLFDTIVTEADNKPMRPVLARRVQYLTNRAEQFAERRVEGDEWHTTITRASLHLEAAEGSAALGEFERAQFALRLAIPHFLELQMPFGAALQRAFQADHGSLAADADRLMRAWTEILLRPERDEPLDLGGTAFTSRAADTPQQWAYYGLAAVLSREPDAARDVPFDALWPALQSWLAVPVGRMRFPMDHYLYVIRFCLVVRRSTNGVRPEEGDDAFSDSRNVVDILGKEVVALYRALQYASVNRYLWTRLFAPAPLFDFDVALLLAAVLTLRGELPAQITRAVVEAVPQDVSRYASEYVSTVRELMRIG